MNFGFGAGDVFTLVQLAWKTVQGARQACGEHDELTREVSSLHRVLRRLHRELSNPKSLLNQADDNDGGRQEMKEHIEGCGKILEEMNTIVAKYEKLSDTGANAKRVWQQVKFGNDEMQDLSKIRLQLSVHTSAIIVSLNLCSLGSQSRVERQLTGVGGDLKGICSKVNWIAAKMAADSGDGTVWTSYTDDDKSFWRDLRRELVNEGYRSSVLHKHKKLIKKYVGELGKRGVFDHVSEEGEDFKHADENDESDGASIDDHSGGSDSDNIEADGTGAADRQLKKARFENSYGLGTKELNVRSDAWSNSRVEVSRSRKRQSEKPNSDHRQRNEADPRPGDKPDLLRSIQSKIKRLILGGSSNQITPATSFDTVIEASVRKRIRTTSLSPRKSDQSGRNIRIPHEIHSSPESIESPMINTRTSREHGRSKCSICFSNLTPEADFKSPFGVCDDCTFVGIKLSIAEARPTTAECRICTPSALEISKFRCFPRICHKCLILQLKFMHTRLQLGKGISQAKNYNWMLGIDHPPGSSSNIVKCNLLAMAYCPNRACARPIPAECVRRARLGKFKCNVCGIVAEWRLDDQESDRLIVDLLAVFQDSNARLFIFETSIMEVWQECFRCKAMAKRPKRAEKTECSCSSWNCILCSSCPLGESCLNYGLGDQTTSSSTVLPELLLRDRLIHNTRLQSGRTRKHRTKIRHEEVTDR